jgi:hypothetical protein
MKPQQLFESKAPSDTRPRKAIEGIRAFALGGKRTGQLRSLAWAERRPPGAPDVAADQQRRRGGDLAARRARRQHPSRRRIVHASRRAVDTSSEQGKVLPNVPPVEDTEVARLCLYGWATQLDQMYPGRYLSKRPDSAPCVGCLVALEQPRDQSLEFAGHAVVERREIERGFARSTLEEQG